jgi:hypothetical protein
MLTEQLGGLRPFDRIPFLGDSHTILAATALLTHFGAPGSAIG